MDKEKLKLITRNLQLLVQSLKEELEDYPQLSYENIAPYIEEDDVDEYYVEEDNV